MIEDYRKATAHKEPNKLPENVKLGHWYCQCCVLDLYQINSHETLIEVKQDLQDQIDDPHENIGLMTWPTIEEAVKYLVRTPADLEDLNHRPDLVTLLRNTNVILPC